ncbi:MAG: hypothetical protein ACK4QL_08345 [Pseudanabaenaceae cyanobacterium]
MPGLAEFARGNADLGRQTKQELENRLGVLLAHLTKVAITARFML